MTSRNRIALFSALLTLCMGLTLPSMAQDGGDAGFDVTASVGVGGGMLGGSNGVDNGVTQLAPVVQGAGGFVAYTVNVSANGNLSVWLDSDDDGDFEDETEQSFAVTAGNNHIEVLIGAAAATAETFVRFIYEDGTNLVSDPNTDYSATVDGEIEDWELEVLGLGSNVVVNTGPGTTTLSSVGGLFTVSRLGNDIFSSVAASINDITIEGDNAADDLFVVDFNAFASTGGSVTVDGNGQAVSDALQVDYSGGGSLPFVSHTAVDASSGSVAVGAQTINYTGLEPVIDNIAAVSRVFTFTAGSDAIVLTEAGGAGDDVISIDSNNSEIVTFDVSATTLLTINAGSDTDTITIDDLDTAFTGAAIVVNGDAGDDTLTLDLAADGPLGHGSVAFDGGIGVNDLLLNSNTYGTATVDFGVGSIGVGAANGITFANTQDMDLDLILTNVVFTMTGGNDTPVLGDDGIGGNSQGELSVGGTDVVFNTPSTNVTLNAGGGSDTVLLREIDSAFAGNVFINGDGGVDELRVDFANDPIPASLTFAGGANADNLEIFNGALAATITHTATSASAGSVTTPQGVITYTQVENATEDNRTATARVFNGTGAADSIVLEDDGLVANGIGSYDADNSPQVLFDVSSTTSVVINGNGGGDTILTRQIDAGYGGTLAVNGNGGNDELRVDFSPADPIPVSLTFTGGTGNDNLEILGGALAPTITHAGTSATAGSVVTPEGTITYSGVENPTEDNRTATARVFTGTAAADAIDLDDDGGASNDIGSYDADTSPEIHFDISATTSVTIDAGAGDDDFDVFQIDGNYTGSVAINGEDDDDHLELHFGSGDPIPAGGFTFDGGAGGTNLDTLELDDGGNQGTITYSDSGINSGSITSASAGTMTYVDVESGITDDLVTTARVFTYTLGAETIELDDSGGASNNRDIITSTLSQPVTFRPATGTLTINAGPGNDDITVNDLDDQFTGNLFVNGDAGDDTVNVDWESNADSPLGGIGSFAYNGGAETTGDDLNLINGTVSYVTHTYADANSGTVEVAVGSDQMTYADIEPIVDALIAVTRTFNFSGVADEIFLDSDFAVGSSQIVTPSPNLPGQNSDVITSEVTTFNDTATTTVIINGGGGSDVFDIEPSDQYTVATDGEAPTTLTPGDQITLNVAALPADEKITLAESSNTAGTYSFSKQGGGASIYQDVSYANMELVTLRFSDPNAFTGSTYEGDWVYPLPGESGISVEPYFNWDIEINQALPGGHPSKYTDLQLDLSLLSDLSSPVFTTNTKEDGVTLLILSAPDEDHYITDLDRDAGILLQNFTEYWWGLTATMTGGQVFCQIQRFTTVDDLEPELDYPDDELTIYDLDFQFDWNVASPAQDDVYWRMELDNLVKGSFVGDDPLTVEGLLMGEDKNDDDLTVADGFAPESEFASSDLPTPLAWGTTYSWRVATMWPVPPTGWVPQEIHDKNETDRLVGVSGVSQFQTVTKAVVPTLTYPVGGLEIYFNEPVLSWNVQGPFAALTFDILINEQGGPGVCELGGSIPGVSGLQFDTADCSTPLLAGKTYEWQVRSSDGVTTTAYSALETFTILGQGVAGPATPSYPVGELEIYTTAPSMHWFTESDATGLSFVVWYEERVGPAAASCTDVKAGGTALPSVGVTQTEVSGLTPGATYDWCVVTTGDNGSFDSGVAVFSVAGGAADAYPIASWPIGNPTTYTLDQLLTWYVEGASVDITSYTVEFCVAPDGFGDPGCTTVAGLTDAEYEITGLDYGDVVVWRVKASYSSGPDSDWTQPVAQGGFTVTGELSSLSAELTYPVGGLIVYDSAAQLNWYVNGATLPEGALTFEVQWSYAEAFPTIGTITQSATTFVPFQDVNDLIPGHTYWWRVRISLDFGSTFGAWSQVASFEVHPGASAVMPRVGSPSRAVTVATSSPMLSWILPTQSTSALTYDLHVGQQPDLSDATVISGLTNTHHRVSDLVSGQYFWAVRSHSEDGTTSALSSVGTFTANGLFATGVETEDDADDTSGDSGSTDDQSTGDDDSDGESDSDDRTDDVGPGDETDGVNPDQDVSDEDEKQLDEPSDVVLPDEWALSQNYPNPFNPTTTIEFSMPNTSGVSVQIYNMLGQVVKTLVNGTMPAGIHRLTWDATDQSGASVSSGMYIYRLESESFQATRTLVLMK